MQNKQLYLFDFDGTLTKVDTLFDFLKFSFPHTYNSKLIKFIPKFLLAKIGILQKAEVKRHFINAFMKGLTKDEMLQLGIKYYEKRASEILRKSGINYIENISTNHDIYIVSASMDIWLKPFADSLRAGLICTQAEFDELGRYTGNFASANCNYHEKKNRILQEIHLDNYQQIVSFGDTKGDFDMFSLADKTYYKFFI